MPTRWYYLPHLEPVWLSERRRTDWHSCGMLSIKERGQLSSRSRPTGERDNKLAVDRQFHFGLLMTAVGGALESVNEN